MNEKIQHSLACAKNSGIEIGTNVIFEYGRFGYVRKTAERGIVEGLFNEWVIIQGKNGGKYNRHISQVRVI